MLGELKGRILQLVTALALFGFARTATAADYTWIDCESSYQGDGWFRYHVSAKPSPFVQSLNLTTFGAGFTNLEQTISPTGWLFTNNYDAEWDVDPSNPPPQIVPYDMVFEAKSTLTNYHQGSGIILLGVTLYEFLGPGAGTVYSENAVGYWTFPVLVPGLPEEDDGSPPTLYTNLSYADITITDLIRNSSGVHGIEFQSADASTLRLEISKDMSTWSKVAYIYGQPGSNSWSNPSSLDVWGSFFRLAYIGYGQIDNTNLPPLDRRPPSTTLAIQPQTVSTSPIILAAPITTTASIEHSRIKLQLNTSPGHKYQVDFLNAGNVVWSTNCIASENRLTVMAPMSAVPSYGIIKTKEIPADQP